MPTPPAVLCLAGFDPSGGAGVLADAKTCAARGAYAATVITALTIQNTMGVSALQPLSPTWILKQADALLDDIEFGAIKIGMLCEPAALEAVVRILKRIPEVPVVLDPVAASSSGAAFWSAGMRERMIAELFPLCALITPNLVEASVFLGREESALAEDPGAAASALRELGARAVLLKGGHARSNEATDVLETELERHFFSAPRLSTANTHGTGCTLSSAIAAELAHGADLVDAVRSAKHYLQAAMQSAADWNLGKGHGPLDHFHALAPRTEPATPKPRALQHRPATDEIC